MPNLALPYASLPCQCPTPTPTPPCVYQHYCLVPCTTLSCRPSPALHAQPSVCPAHLLLPHRLPPPRSSLSHSQSLPCCLLCLHCSTLARYLCVSESGFLSIYHSLSMPALPCLPRPALHCLALPLLGCYDCWGVGLMRGVTNSYMTV